MTVHACYDAKGAAEERDKMQKALKGIESKLLKMDPWAAVNGLRGMAGGYARYFDLMVEDGKLVIERKRNAISFAMNREGMFVMFSHGVGSMIEGGRVTVRLYRQGEGETCLEVEDNGVGISAQQLEQLRAALFVHLHGLNM